MISASLTKRCFSGAGGVGVSAAFGVSGGLGGLLGSCPGQPAPWRRVSRPTGQWGLGLPGISPWCGLPLGSGVSAPRVQRCSGGLLGTLPGQPAPGRARQAGNGPPTLSGGPRGTGRRISPWFGLFWERGVQRPRVQRGLSGAWLGTLPSVMLCSDGRAASAATGQWGVSRD